MENQHVRALRAFISAASEYSRHPNERATIQRSLEVISTLDLSIFNPGTNIAAEFYMSLYELMNSLGSQSSSLIWSAVDVLQNACQNISSRESLNHMYKFVPLLARLLEANLTSEKKIRVLQLLQKLTYGMKISRQEAYFSNLISTLTQWSVPTEEEEIITLSLGVLVNLCYKNLAATYMLMRTIDTKEFIKTLLKLQNHISTSVQCCKLLIILDTNTNLSEKYIMDFVLVTFTNLKTAMMQRDVLVLKHIIDVFNDIGQTENSRNVLLTYSNYGNEVQNILETLGKNTDPECVALMMEFLLSLVKLKIADLIPLYPVCIKSAMTWVPVKQVCSKALAFIRTVIIDSRRTKTSAEVLAEVDLSVLMLVTNSQTDGVGQNGNQTETRQSELMQLFQEMIKTPALKEKIMQSFNEHAMRKLFSRLLNNELKSATKDWIGNFIQNASTNLYIHALALTADLAESNSNWLTLYSELLSRKQVQIIIALALFTGDREVKQKVLQLTPSIEFPQECISAVASCMKELEPLIVVQNTNSDVLTNTISLNFNETPPLFSVAQEKRLDAVLSKFKSAFESDQIGDHPTSAVIELYEYKLAAMKHSERAIRLSLEAADNYAASLQHRLAQVESSRLHQLLFDTQQCLEAARAEKSSLIEKLKEMEEKSKKALLIKKQENESLRKIIMEKSTTVEHLNETLMKCTKELEISHNKNDILSKKVQELNNKYLTAEAKAVDLVNKHHENIEKKNAEIETHLNEISVLKQEMQQMTQTHQQIISEKSKEIQELRLELEQLIHMRDRIISELTAPRNGYVSNIADTS